MAVIFKTLLRKPFEFLSIKHMFWVRKRDLFLQGDVSFTHQKRMFDGKTLIKYIFGGKGGGGVHILCLPLYKSKFQFFEIKSLFPRT